jgi:nitrous oxidase accessory protein NosD
MSCTTSLQALVDAAAPGSVVSAPACVYRETVSINKPLTLRGEPGAQIRGSDDWSTGWTQSGAFWVRGTVPQLATDTSGWLCGSSSNERCKWPEQVFIDGQPLLQVASNPQSGQFAVDSQRRVVLADDPAGRFIEVTAREYWVLGSPTVAGDVTIEGFSMKHAAAPAQRGAVWNWDNPRWTIQHNDMSHSHGGLIFLSNGAGHKVMHNRLSFGGQQGIAAYRVSDTVIQGNTIHDNNTELFQTSWQAGGMKITYSERVTIDANDVHSNRGAGIWIDLGCRDVAITQNRVHHNQATGISYEISYSGNIHRNVIWENGLAVKEGPAGAGVYIQASRDTEVHDNIVAWNADGIIVWSENRSDSPGVVNNFVHHNTIFIVAAQPWDEFGLAWIEYQWSNGMSDPASNNRGADNRYFHFNPAGAPAPFRFVGQWFGVGDLAGFNQTQGESDAFYLTESEKNQILTSVGVPSAPAR